MPPIEARVAGVVAGARRLSRYRRLLGFPAGDDLPVTFPHVLAAPLHLHMLASTAFPLRLYGLVHVANTITQRRALPAGVGVDLHCAMAGHRETRRGQEMTMHTRVVSGGEVAWHGESVFIVSPTSSRRRAARDAARTDAQVVACFAAAAGVGRRYAAVSGDYNPIHLSAATARLFGFRAAIAHGMWSVGRCLAELHQDLSPPLRVEVAFKLPVLLPATLVLETAPADAARCFRLIDAQSGRPHLRGSLVTLT